MSQQFAKIIGPINQGEPFYMGKVSNDNTNQILTYTKLPKLGDIDYSFTNTATNTNVAVLKAEYYIEQNSKDFNPNYIKLYDTINNVYIKYITTAGPFYNPDTALKPIFSYNDDKIIWSYPTLFLANIPYNFENCTNQSIDNCIPDINSTFSGIYIIPQNIYYNINGTCSIPKDPSYTIWMENTTPPSSQPFYWSNLNDCNVDVSYEYCPNEEYCGTNNCKGICPSDDKKNCNYDKSKKNFVCEASNNGTSGTLSFGIIILIVVGVILLIAFISLIVYFNIRKRKKKKKDDSDIDLLTALSQPLQTTQPTQQLQTTEPLQPLQPLQNYQQLQTTEPLQPLQNYQQLQTTEQLQPLQNYQQLQPLQNYQPLPR
jgi:hypothetical protein